MELRVLEYFLAVAREGSLTAAAERLHVGQPTLSRQIKDLERELGAELFERQPRGVRLTRQGRVLLEYAEQMSEISDKVIGEFRSMRDEPLGDVFAGGAESSQLALLARAAERVRVSHAGLRVRYTSGNLSDVESRIDRGLLDFAILSQPANLAKYEALTLPHAERWALYTREDGPLANKSSVTPADLLGEPLIMSEQVMSRRAAGNSVAEWFGGSFASLDVVATFNLAYSGSVWVRGGHGSMLTWEGLTPVGDGIVSIPLDPPVTSWLAVCWRRGHELREPARLLLDELRNIMSVQEPSPTGIDTRIG